ncbi:hypothetical protein ACMU_09760 [Actibacterium mucosum KCTC 23349]|uniref:3-hydroxyacyl-CoA dehydrogenase C-terminal domain-containing protein n=1 Tax=Actibacterium mucosum KCTC 23349 TaxID=1454373 RepID=A0A037ZIV5_9RHOB|nr:enoyl-CoA hydratase/isomerase family protein [Actibacterium mucosum]KAJ56038.1 hypothetical protein ACMU_09760 [Actibacterium mucosum KCTC 23349]
MLRRAVEEGGIARLCLSAPPDNALRVQLARSLAQQITDLGMQSDLVGIILHSDGPIFATGPDLSGSDLRGEHAALALVQTAIQESKVPVVAVIDGLAHGAGLELALAAHTRVAGANARIAHSYLKLGLLPIMGAAHRMTRLAGPAVALEFLRAGRPISAEEAARLGLVDVVVAQGGTMDKAREILRNPNSHTDVLRPVSERHEHLVKPGQFLATIKHYRQMDLPATQKRLVDCVEAAQLLPFETGIDYEGAAFLESQADDTSRALRHLVGATARLVPVDAKASAETQDIRRMAVLGTSSHVVRWSTAALQAGLSVSHIASGDASADKNVAEQVRQRLAQLPDAPQADDKNARALRFQSAAHPDVLRDVDLVLIADPLRVPDTVAAMPPGRIVGLVVSGDAEPSWPVRTDLRTLGLRHSGGLPNADLVELVAPAEAQNDFLNGMAKFVQRLGGTPIRSTPGEGGVATAVWGACVLAARDLVRLGADPAVVDDALAAEGFKVLPFGGRQVPMGRAMRSVSAEDVVARCFDAMGNAGALLVQAGVAQRPGDIDIAMVHGFGLPRALGGPMFAADMRGLLTVRNRMRSRQGEDPEFWAPAPLFDELIKNGKRFADMDRGWS